MNASGHCRSASPSTPAACASSSMSKSRRPSACSRASRLRPLASRRWAAACRRRARQPHRAVVLGVQVSRMLDGGRLVARSLLHRASTRSPDSVRRRPNRATHSSRSTTRVPPASARRPIVIRTGSVIRTDRVSLRPPELILTSFLRSDESQYEHERATDLPRQEPPHRRLRRASRGRRLSRTGTSAASRTSTASRRSSSTTALVGRGRCRWAMLDGRVRPRSSRGRFSLGPSSTWAPGFGSVAAGSQPPTAAATGSGSAPAFATIVF